VASESNITQKGSEFRNSASITNVPKVATSFFLMTEALPTSVDLTGGGP